MKEIKINPHQISHIEITDFEDTEYYWLEYKPKITYLFGLILWQERQKEGWYRDLCYGYMDDLRGTTVRDGKLYYNPFMSIYSGGKKIYGRHYKTVKEIEEVCLKYFPECNVILK